MATEHAVIEVDAETRTLNIPHKGITIRALQALAAKHSKKGTRPWWAISYQGCVVARVRLHTVGADEPSVQK